ncbi:flagellar hook capping FlgD N-terminal domain-containing protein [Paracoccus marinaquae]|uniref:Basal-body rod modification protein FlgD n=1 Tax=Paracoccus marinaquae TaxID=2841926 RepID=A0ABS6AGX5_9RHOB|nr:flagellar hook capping FlgD N-terminal domain-containing protein [Paracoccus marinaquae]MBU3029197.1 flagellar basal body rod modification protein [Paracoccus marinaquae]
MISATSSSAATAASATAASAAAPATTSADFDTFLKMLTAQLQNQDPLNPMEGTEFAVQLATFSGVEQQAQTNKLLNQLIQQMGGGGLGEVAEWIGKEARTTEPVWFGDKALALDVDPHAAADSVILVARDPLGREITREEIGPGSGQIDWFGRDDLGEKLPDGLYSFSIESRRNGEVISEDRVGAYARIIEAETGTSGIKLIFEGGSSAPATGIEALREAG